MIGGIGRAYGINNKRYAQTECAGFDAAVNEQLAKVLRQRNGHLLSVALNSHLARIVQNESLVDVLKTLRLFTVKGQNLIAIAKSVVIHEGIAMHAISGIFRWNNFFTPGKKNDAVNDDTHNHIDQHASNHDDQTLPGRFSAKLPGLSGLRHLLFVHALIHHPRDFHITSQRQPANPVFRFPDFLFQYREIRIEKQVELLNPCLKKFGRNEMAPFMQNDQDG